MLILLIFYPLLVQSKFEPSNKYWKPKFDFNDISNWIMIGDSNCAKDNRVLPTEYSALLEINSELLVRELTLPSDGTVFIGDRGSINFKPTVKGSSSCETENGMEPFAQLKLPEATPWLLSSNWDSEFNNPAVPHLNRIPCDCDNAHFDNEDGEVQALLPSIPSIRVGDILVRNESILNNMGSVSKVLKLPRDGISIESVENCIVCHDATSTDILYDELCINEAPLCLLPMCESPFTPLGHCCEICGAQLLIEKSTFDFDEMSDLRQERFFKSLVFSSQTIHMHNGKVYLQIILIDRDEYNQDNIQQIVKRNLRLDVMKRFNYTIRFSGRQFNPYAHSSVWSMIFGTFFLALGLYAGLFLYYVGYPDKIMPLRLSLAKYGLFNKPFVFAQFRNAGETEETQSISVGVEFVDPNVAHESAAFKNPLYKETPGTSSTTKTDNEPLIETLGAELNQHDTDDIDSKLIDIALGGPDI